MSKSKTLTKQDIVGVVSEATEAMLKGIDNMFDEQDNKLDKRFNKLEVGQLHLKQNINELKQELSNTPSKKEFSQLKARVDAHLQN